MKFSVILCFDKNYQININKVRDAISSYRGVVDELFEINHLTLFSLETFEPDDIYKITKK